ARHMLPRLAAVVEDVGVRAAGFFKSICQDRHPAEGPLLVDGLGDPTNRAVIPGKPGRSNVNRAKRVPEKVAKELGTGLPLTQQHLRHHPGITKSILAPPAKDPTIVEWKIE